MVIKIKVMETRAFMVIIVVETEVSVVGMMIVAEVVVQEEDKEEVVVDTTTTLPVKWTMQLRKILMVGVQVAFKTTVTMMLGWVENKRNSNNNNKVHNKTSVVIEDLEGEIPNNLMTANNNRNFHVEVEINHKWLIKAKQICSRALLKIQRIKAMQTQYLWQIFLQTTTKKN